MSEKVLLDETLSALLDHEAGKTDTLELRRLVRALEDDPELAGRYHRYLLGSAVMRGDAITISTSFLHRVQKGIEDAAIAASVDNAEAKSKDKSWWKMASQLAVAVSVAVVAIVYVQAYRLPDTGVVTDTTFLAENKKLGDNADNRILNPRVLTVGAGDTFIDTQTRQDRTANVMTDCVVVERELPAGSSLRTLQLPEGYVLCRMDENRQRCHAVSASVACAPR